MYQSRQEAVDSQNLSSMVFVAFHWMDQNTTKKALLSKNKVKFV